MASTAPSELEGFQIIAVADIDESVEFTGKLRLFAGEERIGRVPRLALGQKPASPDIVILHCDSDWNVLAVQVWNVPGGKRMQSVEEAKQIVESFYRGSTERWRSS